MRAPAGELVDDEVEHVVADAEPARGGALHEDVLVLVHVRREHPDLVGDAAEEGGIHQVRRLQVGREEDQLVERDREAFAGVELEVVDAAFQRHDPAIQQLRRVDLLAAEIVDEKHAVQRLHVQGRVVGAGVGVVAQLEHVEGEFAAGDCDGAAADHPAGVECLDLQAAAGGEQLHAGAGLIGFLDEGPVQRLVEQFDDLAGDFDGVWHVDGLAEDAGDAQADAGFAVAGGAVEQHRLAGVHRRQQLADVVVTDHQAGETALHGIDVKLLVLDRLLHDLRSVGFERDRCRAEILVLRHRLGGIEPPLLAQSVAHVADDADVDGAEHVHLAAGDRLVEQFLHHAVGQFHAFAEVGQELTGLHAHEFEHEVQQVAAEHPGFGDRPRHDRRLVENLGQTFFRDDVQSHEVVDEAAAERALTVERLIDAGDRRHAAHDEDFS